MRTNLSNVMKALMNGILDTYAFQGIDFVMVNQTIFFTSVFPLYFLRAPENQTVLQTSKSNASRISNLFTRQTDPKRKESKFRERFVAAFDEHFVDELILSCKYLLRNYNEAAFNKWIDGLLLEDVEMRSDENMFFYQTISERYKDHPCITLALVIIWAFHIDDFKPLIAELENHPTVKSGAMSSSSSSDQMLPLREMLSEYSLSPIDVCDFIDIAYKYGISGHLGALAIKTYVDTQTRNNPLISAELADMYFYGNNFKKPNPEKAMNQYLQNASMNYGSALWSVAQISSNERFDINQTPVKMSMHYYERAIQNNHALSYNNVGKWWIYGLHYHLDKVVGLPDYRNIYANQGRQAISDIYQIMLSKSEFNSFLSKYGLLEPINFMKLSPHEKDQLLTQVEDAETYIVDEFIMQAYNKQKYFFSLGSSATLYDYQVKRRKHFTEAYHAAANSKRVESAFKKYETFVKMYAKYQISDAQYAYANYLKEIKADDQDVYEYLYNAVFETPGKYVNYEALLDFLIYHVNPRVVYKKNQIDFETNLLETAVNYLPNIQSKSTHMLNAVSLMLSHLKTTYLSFEQFDTITERLIAESLAHPNDKTRYDECHAQFIEKFKKSRRA